MADYKAFEKGERAARNTQTIYLDTYDDLFSDFDYGPYESRRMSEDLILELEGRLKHIAPGPVDLVFTLPDGSREKTLETMARKRLKQFFSQKTYFAETEIKRIRRGGVYRMTMGLGILSVSTIILFALNGSHPFFSGTTGALVNLFAELLLPAGWFGIWTGLELYFDHPKAIMRKKLAYSMLEAGSIGFVEESKLVQPQQPPASQPPGIQPDSGLPLRSQEATVPFEVAGKKKKA